MRQRELPTAYDCKGKAIIKGIGFIPSPYIPKTVWALDVKGKQVLFRLALKPRSLALIVLSCSQSDGTSNQGDMDADFPGIICSLLKLADPFEGVGFSLLAFCKGWLRTGAVGRVGGNNGKEKTG